MMYTHINALDNLLEDRFLDRGLTNASSTASFSFCRLTAFIVLATPTGISAMLASLVALGVRVDESAGSWQRSGL